MSIQSNFPAIKPTLLLDFANTKELDPRITFTRASTATYYGTQTAKAEENLLLQSQALATSPWSAQRTVLVNNADTAPDGTSTATSITQATGQTTAGQSQQSVTVAPLTYTASVFAKPNGKNFLRFLETLSDGTNRATWFDVQNGTIGTTNAAHTATITASTNGFFRCTITFTVNTARTGAIAVGLADTNGSSTVVDSGGILAWGAQLEQRSTVTAYTVTTTQPVTNYVPQLLTALSGVARFDYNPTTFASLGLLIEEQRTNLLTYSEQFDNAAWTKSGSSITTNTIVAPDGTLTGDGLVEDTATANHAVTQSNTVVANTTYTASCYFKAFATGAARFARIQYGNTAGSNGVRVLFDLSNGTISTAAANFGTGSGASASITPVGNNWYRCTLSGIIDSTSTTGRIDIFLQSTGGSFTATYTGNGYSGIFIWGAQLEAAAFSTSYIQTVASQVTRAADAASMTGANFSSWYNAGEGTFFGAYKGSSGTGARRAFSVNDGTVGNAITLIASNASGVVANYMDMQVNSVTQVTIGSGAYSDTAQTSAVAYKFNDAAFSKNGAAALTDTSCVIPVVTQFEIGQQAASLPLNGTISKLAYYPLRVTNAQLQALTS
jgi:hypothetical protein